MTKSGSHQGIPQEYSSKLQAASSSMLGERRVVTILFCDVTGSVAMAGELDPEDWAEIMDEAFERLIPPIYRYEGTVGRLMGDGLLAFFGAPISHEDDPQRAVLAGLEMLQAIEEFSEQLKKQAELDFDVRIGINTGMVVVGPIGSDLAMEYTAMGDAVNLASRMEQTADPGSVQLAENTYKLVASLFEVEPLGAIEVKGKREAVPAYRVVGRKTEPGRTRGIEGLNSPMIGRHDEFEKLKSVLEDFKNDRGGIVTIIGEAGLGKSRLIEELKVEFESNLDPEIQEVWAELRGLPYDVSVPYGLFLQQLRQTCGVTLDDSPEIIREKVAAEMKDAPSELQEPYIRAVEILLILSRFSDDSEVGSALEGEALKKELFQAILSVWRGLISVIGRNLVVLDDLQWADDASVELLLHLFQLADEMPILLICVMRPYRDSPAWRIKAIAEREYPHRYTEIVLGPLAPGEEQSLARNLLDLPDLPKEMGDLILRKSEGNPLFVEELVRTFIDQGVVTWEEDGQAWHVAQEVGTIPIPGNLQAVIVARIDRLEKEVQRTLQLASVIGRSFYHRVLQKISELEAELDRHLNTLQRVEIIREAARVPELEYMFRHELTRDAAYNTILKKRRREFHKHVGQALEELFPESSEELAPVLAHHFSEAGDAERALKHYTVAGDIAARLFAKAEATSHYDRAIELARDATATPDQITKLFINRGRVFELTAEYEQALKGYEELLSLAAERDSRPMELASLMLQATLRVTMNPLFDPALGQSLSHKAIDLARELNDRAAEAKILWQLTLLYTYTNRPEQAVQAGEDGLAIARDEDLRERQAFLLHDLFTPYLTLGEVVKLRSVVREAHDLWEELGNLPMLADNLKNHSILSATLGDLERAVAYSDESYSVAESVSNLEGQALSRIVAGSILHILGEIDRAIEVMEQAVGLGKQVESVFAVSSIGVNLALLYLTLGATDRGLKLAAQSREMAQQRFMPLVPYALAAEARLHLANDNIAEAEAALAGNDYREIRGQFRAFAPIWILVGVAQIEIELAKENYERAEDLAVALVNDLETTMGRLAATRVLYLQGLAQLGRRNVKGAQETLIRARAEAEGIGSRLTLWKILAALAEIQAGQGETSAAKELRDQAREIIEYIADHTSDPSLRTSFLGRADVRSLLAS